MTRKGILKMNYNRIAVIEHQMKEKFGEEVTRHPRADWDEIDEQEYVEQTTRMNEKFEKLIGEKSYTNKKGYVVSKKLLNDESILAARCPYCDKYKFHFNVEDDLCLNKYGCCQHCFYQYIEGREERWLEGWRPEKDNS